jgi:molybdopterin converting factor small subunit
VAQVNLYAAARAAANSATLAIPAETLGELIAELKSRNPEMAKLLPTCSYLLNGESCDAHDRRLIESDVVDVLPQFAGG